MKWQCDRALDHSREKEGRLDFGEQKTRALACPLLCEWVRARDSAALASYLCVGAAGFTLAAPLPVVLLRYIVFCFSYRSSFAQVSSSNWNLEIFFAFFLFLKERVSKMWFHCPPTFQWLRMRCFFFSFKLLLKQKIWLWVVRWWNELIQVCNCDETVLASDSAGAIRTPRSRWNKTSIFGWIAETTKFTEPFSASWWHRSVQLFSVGQPDDCLLWRRPLLASATL